MLFPQLSTLAAQAMPPAAGVSHEHFMDLVCQLQPELYEEVYFTVCFLMVMNFLLKGHLVLRGC